MKKIAITERPRQRRLIDPRVEQLAETRAALVKRRTTLTRFYVDVTRRLATVEFQLEAVDDHLERLWAETEVVHRDG